MLRPYPYRWRNRQSVELNKNRLKAISVLADPVALTGFVKGKQATDLEERFGRALQVAGLAFRFQVRISTAGSLPWHEKIVDFLVRVAGTWHPVEVDGQIGHRTSTQRGQDAIREVLLNEVFIRWGYFPLVRVAWSELETQEMADKTVERMFV